MRLPRCVLAILWVGVETIRAEAGADAECYLEHGDADDYDAIGCLEEFEKYDYD